MKNKNPSPIREGLHFACGSGRASVISAKNFVPWRLCGYFSHNIFFRDQIRLFRGHRRHREGVRRRAELPQRQGEPGPRRGNPRTKVEELRNFSCFRSVSPDEFQKTPDGTIMKITFAIKTTASLILSGICLLTARVQADTNTNSLPAIGLIPIPGIGSSGFPPSRTARVFIFTRKCSRRRVTKWCLIRPLALPWWASRA